MFVSLVYFVGVSLLCRCVYVLTAEDTEKAAVTCGVAGVGFIFYGFLY